MKYFALLLLFLSAFVRAEGATTVKWGTDQWEGFTDYDGTGFYHELMRQIFPLPQFELEVSYFPWKRSLKHLTQEEIDMTGGMPKNNAFYQSDKPVLSEKILLVSRETLDRGDIQQMLGAYRAGYDDVIFYAALPNSASGIEVKSVEQGLALLRQGKVDFYVDTEILINRVFSEGIRNGEFQSAEVGDFELFWSFARNSKGKTLKRHFDAQVALLNQQGTIPALYQKYAIAMPY